MRQYWLVSLSCLLYVCLLNPHVYTVVTSKGQQVVKGVNAGYDGLIDFLETIERMMTRLNIYTGIPPTGAVNEIIVSIIMELLSTLAVVTKHVKDNRQSKPDLY